MRYPLVFFVLLAAYLLPIVSHAQIPPELPPRQCVEGVEHHLQYGERVLGCEIDPVTDLDFFAFSGSVNDRIRITISTQQLGDPDWLDPKLELRDPLNTPITTQHCGPDDCTFTILEKPEPDRPIPHYRFLTLISTTQGHTCCSWNRSNRRPTR